MAKNRPKKEIMVYRLQLLKAGKYYCTMCKTVRPLHDFNKSAKVSTGIRGECIYCRDKNRGKQTDRDLRRALRINSENTRYCTQCDRLRDSKEFHKNHYTCKMCRQLRKLTPTLVKEFGENKAPKMIEKIREAIKAGKVWCVKCMRQKDYVNTHPTRVSRYIRACYDCKGERKCVACELVKPLNEYYKIGGGEHTPQCKGCFGVDDKPSGYRPNYKRYAEYFSADYEGRL